MPIRMIKDENQKSRDNYPDDIEGRRSGGRGGLGPFMGCLPMVFGLLFKRPKLLLLILILGALFYFFMIKGSGCNMLSSDSSDYTTGGRMDPAKYDKVEVYEPLADNKRNPLPEKKTLENYAPKRLNQGQQGSCVAWSSAYAARTIMEAQRTGQDPNQLAFSPSFLYNVIHLDNCQGAYINEAMEVMKKNGVAPFREMPYDDSDCSQRPNNMQIQSASKFKTAGYQRLSMNGDDQKVNMLAIKQNIAAGAPVVFGMMVGESFMRSMLGKSVWIPSGEDYNMYGFGGHAMCVVGYDDYKEGGAFRIMNSWGMEWGEKGFAWIKYKDFEYFTKEAYGLYPMGNINAPSKSTIFALDFGLYDVATDKVIKLKKVKDNIFTAINPLAKGSKFKALVQNTVECYTYIFGQETDGSSYVLFPYTAKHSPYCGITGLRLFPKDYSMVPDETGNKDYIAIIITKQPIDYEQMNKTINSVSSTNYAEKINKALGSTALNGVQYIENNEVVNVSGNGTGAIGIIIEIPKK